MKRLVSTFAALGLISLVGAGCNPLQDAQDKVAEKIGQKVVESAIEKAIEKDSGKKVNVELGNKGVSLQGENGQAMAFGENVAFPEGFPSTVPRYPNGKVSAVTLNPGQVEAGYTLTTSDAGDKVVAWFKHAAEDFNWKQKTLYNADQITLISYEGSFGSSIQKLNISVSSGAKGADTSVIVGWSSAQNPKSGD